MSATHTPHRPGEGNALAVLVAVIVAPLLVGAAIGLDEPADHLSPATLAGLSDGDVLNIERLEEGVDAALETDEPDDWSDAVVTVGDQVLQAEFDRDGRMPLAVDDLEDGEYEIAVYPDPENRDRAAASWSFEIDTRLPELELDDLEVAVGDEPLVVTGRTEPDAALTINGEAASVESDGAFAGEVDPHAADEIIVAAESPAANVITVETATAWVPSRSEVQRINALHVSFHGWASDGLREPILRLAEEGRINTVQLDLKDEGGHIGYDTEVPLANEIGANLAVYDLEEAVKELHSRGVRVVGRIVAFADPVLAPHAWESGERDMVVQRPKGEMYTGRYAGFTSFAHPTARQYNIDLAEEAVRAGVDDILWDYIRRPDGPVEEYYFGGLDDGTEPEESIVEFLREADRVITHYGAGHGASVYGIAATRPTQIAQDIPAMAPHLDFVAPMVYYSHWGPGEYDVADPNADPYAITHRSLVDFVEAVEGKRAQVVPWLQDFRLGGPHGEHEVREQIRAAADAGITEWIMWDPAVRYTTAAFDPLPDAPEEDEEVDAPGDGGVIDEDAAEDEGG